MNVMRFGASASILVLVAAAGLAAGCGGGAAGDGAAGGEHATPTTAAKSFDSLTHDERVDLMKHVVLPAMKTEFTAWEGEEFAAMNCATCHGAGAKDKTFEMPNPKLPKLPADAEGWKKLEAEEADAVKFMRETVVPKMAAMLGEQPYDPATGKGFGCFECHTTK